MGKSVLESAIFYGGDKGAYWAKKSGKLTHREILKRDVEHCLSLSRSPEDLITRLKSMGYEIRNGYDGKNISVIAPGWQRAVRLSSIGYTKDVLNEWLAENRQDVYFYQWRNANPIRKATPLLYMEIEFRKAQRMDGLTLIFAIFIELLRLCTGNVEQQKNRPLSPMLREEVRKLDQYIEDYELLCAENIGTLEELSSFTEDLQEKINELEAQRNSVRNRIRRTPPDDTPALKEQAKEITKQITPLRKQLKSAQRIAERMEPIRQLLNQERQMEQKERNRIRERSYER